MTATKTQPGIRSVVGLKDVAEHFSVTTRTVQNWIADGTFPRPYRIGRRILRWDAATVDAWIESGCPNVSEVNEP